MKPDQLKTLLDEAVEEINRPSFIPNDPVQFPRRFSRTEDIEITAFLSSMIAWGNRKMILRDIERLLSEMDNTPFLYLKEKAYLNFPEEQNIHRTFFGKQFRHLMNGLYQLYSRYGTMHQFAISSGCPESEAPAWTFTETFQRILADANGGKTVERCLPSNLDQTALKRINMLFRWLVRDDGIVDLGIWKDIPKSKLFIPLDVHVANISRELGLLSRRSNDRKAVIELTDKLRQLNPDDPVIYDFALFGIGVNKKGHD